MHTHFISWLYFILALMFLLPHKKISSLSFKGTELFNYFIYVIFDTQVTMTFD